MRVRSSGERCRTTPQSSICVQLAEVRVIGHRGASKIAPENMMASFDAARRLGAHGVEFDVQQCVDGELVVVHDFTLDRTTNGSGLVVATAVDGLSTLDAGSWFSPDFAGERVPRLSEVLDLIDVEFELELKGYGHGFLAAVVDEVVERNVLDRVEFTSSNIPLLTVLKTELPAARVGFFSQPQHPSLTDEAFEHLIVGVARTAPFDVAHVHAANITASIVDRLHELGLTVHANDARDGTDVQRAIDARADRLSIDDIETAVSTVNRQCS